MKFGEAAQKMFEGHKVCRSGWNGKGMFLFSIAGNDWDFVADISGVGDIDTLPFICMKTADNKLVPWLASQTDIFAEDWEVIND